MFKTKKIVLALGFVAQTGFSLSASAQSNYNITTTPIEPQQIQTADENQCLGQDIVDAHRFIDLRDLVDFKTRLPGTSTLLMTYLKENPQIFLSGLTPRGSGTIGERATNAQFYRQGAQGPSGSTEMNGTKKIFKVTKDPVHTRKNAILAVEIEDIKEEKCDSAFKMKLNMFVHDDNTGHFFRRIWVRVDFTKELTTNGEKLQILEHVEDIALADTEFKVYGDLLDRKVILKDERNQITKIMPIGVGAIDIQPQPTFAEDGSWSYDVDLMTYEFPEATIQKTETELSHWANTRSRIYPAYYSARPFISLFDNAKGYRAIGMHYKITGDLLRGFVSHGCIRVRDVDLYQIDAILNEGPHEKLVAKFVKHLPEFENLDHPLPKLNGWFNQVTYKPKADSHKPNLEKVACKNSSYAVRFTRDYHTLADEDCLTMIRRQDRHASSFIDYILGQTDFVPEADLADKRLTHVPLQAELNHILSGGSVDRRQQLMAELDSYERHKLSAQRKYQTQCSYINADCVAGRLQPWSRQCSQYPVEQIQDCRNISQDYHWFIGEIRRVQAELNR